MRVFWLLLLTVAAGCGEPAPTPHQHEQTENRLAALERKLESQAKALDGIAKKIAEPPAPVAVAPDPKPEPKAELPKPRPATADDYWTQAVSALAAMTEGERHRLAGLLDDAGQGKLNRASLRRLRDSVGHTVDELAAKSALAIMANQSPRLAEWAQGNLSPSQQVSAVTASPSVLGELEYLASGRITPDSAAKLQLAIGPNPSIYAAYEQTIDKAVVEKLAAAMAEAENLARSQEPQ